MSHITLIATIGSSPSVLTETIWKLNEQNQRPDEVIVLTTSHGKSELNRQLFDNRVWDAMCGHMEISTRDIEFPTKNIHVLKNADDSSSDDLRTYDDCMRFGDLVMEVVRKQCSDPEKTVYVSIAGGRKTMGAQLMSAMQVFGRERDKIYHVLIDDRFETAGFYYPAQNKQLIEGRKGPVTASDAEIELFEVPFIPIGQYLGLKLSQGQTFQSYREQVMADLYAKTFRFTLDPAKRVVYIGGDRSNEVILSARPFMWLLYFALKNAQNGDITNVIFRPLMKHDDMTERLILQACYYMVSKIDLDTELANDSPWFKKETLQLDSDLSKSRNDFVKGLSKVAVEIGQEVDTIFTFEKRPGDKMKANNTLLIPPDRIRFNVDSENFDEWSSYLDTMHRNIPNTAMGYPDTVEKKKALQASLRAFFKPLLQTD